jgi:hypothetical protein
MTATLKSKQTSIATVRYHLLPVASLLTPLIFHYPLPLKEENMKFFYFLLSHKRANECVNLLPLFLGR